MKNENQLKDVFLSVVIPVYNEEDNVEPMHRQIVAAVDGKFKDYEIIFINDGSRDASMVRLKALHQKDPRAKVINFRKNFGQATAISAGFDYCRGDVVVTLDGDLQNDPADIPLVTCKLLEGFDIVNGWRKDRKDKFITRRIPSFLGNKLISFITKVKLHDYGCTLRAFRKDVVKNLKLYGEMHRYIPAIASKMGINSVEMPVNHRERIHGTSKYGLSRTFRVVLDLISLKYLLSFSHRPLQMFGGLGMLMMGTGFLSGLYLTYVKYFQGEAIAGRPLLFFTVLAIFLGFQSITLGLIAEMLTRIYHEGLDKNVYTVRDLIGFDEETIAERTRPPYRI
ncbi:MAG: glycosyltransferase family 2 protein [bacterium]|nr:glycosyltransferase family 2 protein [bacterium]